MFAKALQEKINQTTPIAVGIDLNLELMSQAWRSQFDLANYSNRLDYLAAIYLEYGSVIIDAVQDLVPALKLQIAFFEPLGWRGIKVVEQLLALAKEKNLLVIMDAKRGDVPSTAVQYATAYLNPESPLESEALTLNPYLGRDSLEPFLSTCEKYQKGLFICLKTSNPGSGDLQDLKVDILNDEKPSLYNHLAKLLIPYEERLAEKNSSFSSLGVVVGATYPTQAKEIRSILKKAFFLVPGLGSQGGNIEDAVHYFNQDGGAIFNFSRAVIYPKSFNSAKTNLDNLKNDLKNAIRDELNIYIEKLNFL